jgi:hypothetical protein
VCLASLSLKLRKLSANRRRILTAAQLLAERMDATDPTAHKQQPSRRTTAVARAAAATAASGGAATAAGGFDWCAEVLRANGHPLLAAEVQLSKAGRYLAVRDVAAATAVFKEFENKENALRWGCEWDDGALMGMRMGVLLCCWNGGRAVYL